MSSDQDDTGAPDELAPKTITERFDDLEAGNRIDVNNHELSYEVVDTDTYSVIAEDPHGNKVTFSKNLQTGGWSLSEEIFHVVSES